MSISAHHEPSEKFALPPAPESQQGLVKAWSEAVSIPAYPPATPDKNPMFLETRVYQGSSGKVYPLPFIDRIATEKIAHLWQAVHLENEFIRVMILPELGGRIHVGLDKTNGYDFFYRHNVIKPALVGLAGPWVSGGVEFNWPQHHRPATFLPVATHVEEHPDGSRTVWCSDHDPMSRMKGMHGICLYPGRAYVELKVRLFNRTPFVQTFLWWANAAVHVDENYQSFFPPDVHYVADHAKRAITTYPRASGSYYGVDYPSRARPGVVPAADDLSWYANIPVPTSYMALGSSEDFFGGYDHRRHAGLIHVADHHIAPGKKQWTWGSDEFGYAWDRNLTDNDGPYIELMAGVYTDNQPDFSFLHPYETKTFSQFWYPIQKIGPAHKANADAALSLQAAGSEAARIGVCVTRAFPKASVVLQHNETVLAQWTRDLQPGDPLVEHSPIPAGAPWEELTLKVLTSTGRPLLSYTPQKPETIKPPQPATELPLPKKVETVEELYLIGLHLQQYRHATRQPEEYWREGLRRNGGDSRCNNAMGLWHLRGGDFVEAETHFRRAITTLTARNPNPYDGEPFYGLGLALRYQERDDEAYDAFYKATWNFAWRAPALYAIAELDTKRGNYGVVPKHLYEALRLNADNNNARNLAVVLFRRFGKANEAEHLLRESLSLDPLDAWACHLSGRPIPGDNQTRLDLAFDYARAGLYGAAIEVLTAADTFVTDGSLPMVHYALASFYMKTGDLPSAQREYAAAAQSSPDYCFPHRLEEMAILARAIALQPHDVRAQYYLGNLLYDRRRHEEAIQLWESSAELDPSFATVWRNLGIGYYNVRDDAPKAFEAFDQALAADGADARILYERDQLWKRAAVPPALRLQELESRQALAESRDDLYLELAALFNNVQQPLRALQLLSSRKFQPWEGGEGVALEQHVRTHLILGREALKTGNPVQAQELFLAALHPPVNLGEARHLLASAADVHFWLGEACSAANDHTAAREHWRKAAVAVTPLSETTFYSGLALARLEERSASRKLLRELWYHGRKLAREKGQQIDYFATSLPAMLLFKDDLGKRSRITGLFLQAQARLGLGQYKLARRLLDQVLALDPNHGRALDLLAELSKEQ